MAGTASIPVYAKQVEPVAQELCFSGWACRISALVTELWLFVVTSAVAVLLLLALGYLQSARSLTAEEQSRSSAEREAFLRFARQVKQLETAGQTTPQLTADAGVSTLRTGTTQRQSLENVRQAYRETVMAVSHYDEDYGEPLVENLTIEFGQDIAQAVADGDQLSPQLQQILVAKAKQAADDRARMMTSLDQEAAFLQDAEDTFASIQEELEDYTQESLRLKPYHRFTQLWDRLETSEQDCRNVLRERQEHLREEQIDERTLADEPGFIEYLYEPLEVEYPVLRTGTEMIERIERARQNLTSAVDQRA